MRFEVVKVAVLVAKHDSLTLRDVLQLDGIRDMDPESLLTPTEIDRVLQQLD